MVKYCSMRLNTLDFPRFTEVRVKTPAVTLTLSSCTVTVVFCNVITLATSANCLQTLPFYLQTSL